MDLVGVKGLGPAKRKALEEAGIRTVQDLAGLDLRRGIAIEGITLDGLKALKQEARRSLTKAGIPFEKAPYGDKGPEKPTRSNAPWWKRLFRRK